MGALNATQVILTCSQGWGVTTRLHPACQSINQTAGFQQVHPGRGPGNRAEFLPRLHVADSHSPRVTKTLEAACVQDMVPEEQQLLLLWAQRLNLFGVPTDARQRWPSTRWSYMHVSSWSCFLAPLPFAEHPGCQRSAFHFIYKPLLTTSGVQWAPGLRWAGGSHEEGTQESTKLPPAQSDPYLLTRGIHPRGELPREGASRDSEGSLATCVLPLALQADSIAF